MVLHLDHGAAGFSLHEEDLGHIAVLTHEVKQSVTVHLAHRQVVHNHHAAPESQVML